MKKIKTYELGRRLLFTISILIIYMVGRSLLLYRVDPAAYELDELDAQNIMLSMLSGDRYQYTLFALGIMPYITATLLIWIYMAIRGAEYRARFSPQKTERLTLIFMVIIALFMAVSRARELVFKKSSLDVDVLRLIAVLEMLIGAVLIYEIAKRNKEQGIGGQTPLILVNILDNLYSTIQKFTWEELAEPLMLCMIMAVVILIMENLLIHIPVQRVSIHNSYADKSYIAFKCDPIGVMPVMFAVSFFMFPQFVIDFLLFLDGENQTLQMLEERMKLTDVMGVTVYLGIIFLLNVLFSFLMLAPGEMAEQLQKGGDSIVGVYAGRKTKRYLRKKLLLLSMVSGCILCLMMGYSLYLSLQGEISSELSLFPSTAMILIGILCPIYQEMKTYRKFDAYSFFM